MGLTTVVVALVGDICCGLCGKSVCQQSQARWSLQLVAANLSTMLTQLTFKAITGAPSGSADKTSKIPARCQTMDTNDLPKLIDKENRIQPASFQV